jgi:RecA-family ATPase
MNEHNDPGRERIDQFFHSMDESANDKPVNGQAPAIEPLRLIDPTMWQGLVIPERRWIVPDWIPCGVATGLYGPPGYGKTLLAQQLMTSTAIMQPWLGCSVSPVKSIAFLCEDDEDELHRRQDAINRLYGCNFHNLGTMRLVPRLGFDNTLMTFKDGRPELTPFYEQVLSETLQFGAQLVIIDTVADTFGGDQNNMGHARQFVQFGLAHIAREIGGSVLACAHPSQSGKASGSGESGSVQWDAAFRSRLYVESPKQEEGEPPDDNARTLTRKKANYARRNETIELLWRDGAFISKHAPTGILGSIERRVCERVFLDLLDRISAEGRYVSEKISAPNYAPRLFEKRPDREGYRKADFQRAMEALFARHEIIVGTYRSSDRHDYPCIIRCGEARGGLS